LRNAGTIVGDFQYEAAGLVARGKTDGPCTIFGGIFGKRAQHFDQIFVVAPKDRCAFDGNACDEAAAIEFGTEDEHHVFDDGCDSRCDKRIEAGTGGAGALQMPADHTLHALDQQCVVGTGTIGENGQRGFQGMREIGGMGSGTFDLAAIGNQEAIELSSKGLEFDDIGGRKTGAATRADIGEATGEAG
jgi:hypothetical protein